MKKILKQLAMGCRKLPLLIESRFDHLFLNPQVPPSDRVSHRNWQAYLHEAVNKPGMRVLEVGSREVTGLSGERAAFSKAEYIGFDYYPGNNVDVVGDVHRLSSYFKEDERFDLVYSSACFEHFAMPWIAAVEMAKMVKVGGLIFVETHYSFSAHERPWHFFQFSDMALKVLFSEAMGIECIEAGVSNPIVGRFSSLADPYLKNKPVGGLYCHSEFLGRKTRDMGYFNWSDVDMGQLVGGTKYPEKN